MTIKTTKIAAALELLPEEMREAEAAVQYLLEQGEKFRLLRELVAEGRAGSGFFDRAISGISA